MSNKSTVYNGGRITVVVDPQFTMVYWSEKASVNRDSWIMTIDNKASDYDSKLDKAILSGKRNIDETRRIEVLALERLQKVNEIMKDLPEEIDTELVTKPEYRLVKKDPFFTRQLKKLVKR